jgi:hypothetical protein
MWRVPLPILLEPTAQFHVMDPPSGAISASLRKAGFGRELVMGEGLVAIGHFHFSNSKKLSSPAE